jgi:hypothetical protein
VSRRETIPFEILGRCMSRINPRRVLIVPAATLCLAAVPAAYEPGKTFKASDVLSAKVLKGPHHTIAEDVSAEGYYQRFHIKSDFGEVDAEGRTVLRTRVAEVGALAQLSEVSKSEIFMKAAGGAVLNVGKGVVGVVTNPEATVKGIGGGIKRMGVNLGRKGKRAADSATKDDKKPEGPPQKTEDKALDAAGGAANSVFGVNSAARRWAQKLHVDPYTSNPVLHKALVDVGKIDSAGSIATKVIIPIPPVVSTTATVGNLVWAADPEEVRKTNEARLTELGVTKQVASRFLVNGNYTLTSQTRFIGALHQVKPKGGADYVDAAAEAEDEREALFFVESAEMLVGMHKAEPVSAILEDSRAMVAKSGTRAAVLLPVDWVRWTEALQKGGQEIAGRAKQELGAGVLEVRVSGTATPAARQGLAEYGWTVKERVVAGLTMPPAD